MAGMRSKRLVLLLLSVAIFAPPSGATAAERKAARAPAAPARDFVRSNTGSLQRCYEDTLRQKPSARGKVRVRVTIASDGAVRDVTVLRNELGPEMAECVRATIQAWKAPFRPPEPVVVEMPFAFTPVG